MKKRNMKVVSAVLMLIMLIAAGCNSGDTVEESVYENETATEAEGSNESVTAETESETTGEAVSTDGDSLELRGLKEDFSVSVEEILAMESITTDVKHISSSGEESVDTVTGVILDTILAAKGESQKDYTTIRFIAGDGYAVSVPSEIVKAKDIILTYEVNGEPLEEKKQPLRVAINDVRSMYFVSNLKTIEFSMDEVASEEAAEQTIIMLETAMTEVESQDYMYYDTNDQAILISDMFASNSVVEASEVNFVAADGFEKIESYDVVIEGFIKHTGEDAPLFTGLDLPIGMNIKYILTMTVGDKTFASVNSGLTAFENIVIDGDKGIVLNELVKSAGLKADTYVLTATDGYSVEVAKDALKTAVAYVNNSSTVTVKFDSADPKKSKVKNLLTITAGDGSNVTTFEGGDMVAESGSGSGSGDGSGDGSGSSEEVEAAWTITFDGLSDGSFDMTSDRAERKLELVALHTERMKNDEKKPEDWEGYKVMAMLDFLKVEDYTSLTVVADDGYEIVLEKAIIDEETIIAVNRDGEELSSIQLVQNTEFATTWVKGVVKIIVNP